MSIKNKLLNGIKEVVDVVRVTLGAMGKTVAIKDGLRLNFHLTKDGVTVAKYVKLEGQVEEVGAMLLREAVNKTVDEAGDGTTTTCLLVDNYCTIINKQLNLGENPKTIEKKLNEDLDKLIAFISKKSKKVKTLDEIKNIAKLSSNNDEEVSEIIKSLYKELGFNCLIDIKESENENTFYEIAKGFKLENTGYANSLFINNQTKGTVELLNPNIFILNDRINNVEPLTELFMKQNSPTCEPLVILCTGIEETELAKILTGMTRNMLFNVYVLVSNQFYYQTEGYFYDLAKFTNGQYSTSHIGELGKCEKLIATKDEVYFINGNGDINEHIESLRNKKEEVEKKLLKDRILNLESSAGVIFVGGITPSEAKEKLDRVEDAVLSVKSAVEDGYVGGASSVFLEAYSKLDISEISKSAMLCIYNQLMINADLEPQYYLKDIIEINSGKGGYGYNVLNNRIENMEKVGVIESSKVLKSALKNSISVAKTFINLEKVI